MFVKNSDEFKNPKMKENNFLTRILLNFGTSKNIQSLQVKTYPGTEMPPEGSRQFMNIIPSFF